MHHDDDASPATKGDIRKMLHLVLQEIVDTRFELKEDMANLDRRLTKKIDNLASEFQAFRIQTNQNFVVFIKNQKDLDQRVFVLERKI